MRFFVFLFCSAALCSAADFRTGQAARAVIGQPNLNQSRGGVTQETLGVVGGLALAGNTLIAVDANRLSQDGINNRVVIYRDLLAKLPKLEDEVSSDRFDRCRLCIQTADVVVGQKDFITSTATVGTATGLRTPTSVATDGTRLVVADTDNNRVLIWNTIPESNGVPANVVVGQADFNGTSTAATTTERGLRGPQGVWIQNGKLYVADTSNDRILIWNTIPTSNGQPANVVLGQPNFTSRNPVDIGQSPLTPQPNTLSAPVSVTTDGTRLLVSDLGHNRVLLWNSLPTQNQQPADLALGQPDMVSAVANNSSKLCESNGTSSTDGSPTYPQRCAATLDFPRYALSDGQRLFVSDTGNDRVLVYNTVPTRSGASADAVLGQQSFIANAILDVTDPVNFRRSSAADALRTPLGLAWDGTNLFVADTYNHRIMVYSGGEPLLPFSAVRNAASVAVYANASFTISGTITAGNEIILKIGDIEYKHTVVAADTIPTITTTLANLINTQNGGDPNVSATPSLSGTADSILGLILLTAKKPGEEGNGIATTFSLPAAATLAVATSGGTTQGGQDAALIAPGSLITILGQNLAPSQASADMSPEGLQRGLPRKLADTEVYVDGVALPLMFVSPTQINAQMPFEVYDAQSVSLYVRSVRNGSAFVSAPIAVPIITENPGVFATGQSEPRAGVVYHASSRATGTVSIDSSTITANDVATITIEDRPYSYTAKAGDTPEIVRDALVAAINAAEDERVTAQAGGVFTRIRLFAKQAGPEGNGIAYSTSVSSNASIVLTAYSGSLCCASTEGAPVTVENPAVPGEQVYVIATGLGQVQPGDALGAATTGFQYNGPELNYPNQFVDALAGGKTANVLEASLLVGAVGLYKVVLELSSDLPTDQLTQARIAQAYQVSNVFTFPVRGNEATIE